MDHGRNPAGTQLLKDINPGPGNGGMARPIVHRDAVLFMANDGEHGQELWRTRGTAATTVLVKDINPGAAGSQIDRPRQVGDVVAFSATAAATGSELWTTDGTPAGTRLVYDLMPGSGTSVPILGTTLESTLFFSADDGVHGRELWSWTARSSTTSLRTPRTWSSRQDRRRKIVATVRVAATDVVATGQVTLTAGARVVGRATLVRGVAKVRITTRLGVGDHVLRARYLGSLGAQSSMSPRALVRVKR